MLSSGRPWLQSEPHLASLIALRSAHTLSTLAMLGWESHYPRHVIKDMTRHTFRGRQRVAAGQLHHPRTFARTLHFGTLKYAARGHPDRVSACRPLLGVRHLKRAIPQRGGLEPVCKVIRGNICKGTTVSDGTPHGKKTMAKKHVPLLAIDPKDYEPCPPGEARSIYVLYTPCRQERE